ncbi:hypothetical protein B0T16DRAFT_414925 [Cercophora newfieldiana]|uniref:F-box domain-containing protein n=1 Tax=Cercophora newfieldiana TaxID=92897 RepID=A0AA40CL35_9PEZI|nr:hypothetical protein B0T16DRAFT_414925 [Cercophora newfieldiana]
MTHPRPRRQDSIHQRITPKRRITTSKKKKKMELDSLPTEILRSIFDELDLTELRALRLVCRRLDLIASHSVMKELVFRLYKPDFDMLQSIASRPEYAEHVTSLLYDATMMSSKGHDFEAHVQACLRRRSIVYYYNGILGDGRDRTRLTEADLRRDFEMYERFFATQQKILDDDIDYRVLEEVISKLPNLREISVSSNPSAGEAEIEMGQNTWGSLPFEWCEFCDAEVSSGGVDYGDGPSRHLRALFRGVHKAGTQLRAIRAKGMHYSFFDSGKFGLARMTHLFENLTCFEISIGALAEWDYDWYENQQDRFILAPHVVDGSVCRTTMQQGVLRTALLKMPNLTKLRLIIFGIMQHWQIANGSCQPPALEDMISPEQSWPKLEVLTLEGMYAKHEQLADLILRHNSTLVSLELNKIRIQKGSWRNLLPQLKDGFSGRQIHVKVGHDLEDWNEEGERNADWVHRGGQHAVQEYFDDPGISRIPLESGARASARIILPEIYDSEEWTEDEDTFDLFA